MSNTYKVFGDTSVAFKRIFSALNSAKKSIYVETYKIDDDTMGWKLFNILVKKSYEIKTELMVDYWGIEKEPRKKLKKIKNAPLEYIIFNPLHFTIKMLSIKKLFEHLSTRNHRKLIIIDEELAFVGGMNFNSEELSWKDFIVEIRGDIVKQLIAAAKEMKNIAKKTKPFEKRFINKSLTKNYSGKDLIFRQIPGTRHRSLKKSFFRMLDGAKKEILFTTPYFVPDLPFIAHLRKAVKRGVIVKIIIPKKCDHFTADILNKWFAFIEHNEGSHIYLYNKGMTHAKYTIVDGKVCTFGSSNMDYQTWLHNYELNIMSDNEKLSKDLKKLFTETLKDCIEFNHVYWIKRSWLRKILLPIIKLFKKHY